MSKCPPTDEWIKKLWYVHAHAHTCTHACAHTHTHTHTQEYHSAIKKNEILPSAATWMDLKGVMLSEISQTLYGVIYV